MYFIFQELGNKLSYNEEEQKEYKELQEKRERRIKKESIQAEIDSNGETITYLSKRNAMLSKTLKELEKKK